MEKPKLYIRNMVCPRCIRAVEETLYQQRVVPVDVQLGEVTLATELSSPRKQQLGRALEALGFELIDNQRVRLIEQVKNRIIELVHRRDGNLQTNLSDDLSDHLHHDYHYLSNLFSEVEGTTIEKYFIAQKIERVKELLVYDEGTLSEIADRLHYSSVAHLSAQFKKVTGLTPSHFKRIGARKRKPLDGV